MQTELLKSKKGKGLLGGIGAIMTLVTGFGLDPMVAAIAIAVQVVAHQFAQGHVDSKKEQNGNGQEQSGAEDAG